MSQTAITPINAKTADLRADLAKKIEARTARVAVLGLGYVGLPLILGFADVNFPVLGLDVDQSKIDNLQASKSYLKHIPSDVIANAMDKGNFELSTALTDVVGADVIIICLPTPLTKHREPDLSYLTKTAEIIAPHLKRGQLVILESTTYPGTTREVMIPLLEKSGLKSGESLFVAFSPEREDPGNPDFNTRSIPKVIGGDGEDAAQLADALYSSCIDKTVLVSSLDTAEAVKLTENIFRSVNIALVNELKVVYDAMGVDVWEVINAAKTKPFGFMPFYPGPGLGGHCIPIDPFYLTWKAREFDLHTRFIELSGEIIASMPRYVVDRLSAALDTRFNKGLNGTKILILGMAYKKNVDDMRETPSFKIMDLLEDRGAQLDYFDPYIPVIPQTREHPEYTGRQSITLSDRTIASYDAVVISTDHDNVDYAQIVKNAKLVIDTRNATAEFQQTHDNIVKA